MKRSRRIGPAFRGASIFQVRQGGQRIAVECWTLDLKRAKVIA